LTDPRPINQRSILLFWLPLASTWWMMAVEGPFLAALVARLADPEFNLGAYGVTFALAVLIESPVIMLMTASTALARDAESFDRLRRFALALSVGCTVALMLFLLPPVYDLFMVRLMALPNEIVRLAYPALWILLPWPGAIGYRRFYQGLMIRDGRTRMVALGTAIRVLAMSATGGVLFVWVVPAGAHLAAAALAVGVTAEALASRWMARPSVRRVLASPAPADRPAMGYGSIARFYYPLALTSLIGLSVHPMVTFLMGRAPSPVESLAVLPVVNSLSFLFRAGSLAFQEVTIALMGDRYANLRALRRFTIGMGLVMSGGLALVALTPLSVVWFQVISGLSPELAAFAIVPTMILVPLPFVSTFLSLFRGVLVTAHDTRFITMATALEVGVILVGFAIAAFAFGLIGVTAAAVGFLLGRMASVSFLFPWTRRSVRSQSD
jgi:hypothetical protein